jgi:hypothetical protein
LVVHDLGLFTSLLIHFFKYVTFKGLIHWLQFYGDTVYAKKYVNHGMLVP